MILRFTGAMPDRAPHYRPDALLPFEVGRAYEVAEIFEAPGFLMVRDVGAREWPTPGDRGFLVDPYLFEQAEDSVDILSCGYEYCDFLTSGFGTIVTNREHVNQIQGFEKIANAVDGPAAGESQAAWVKRCAQELSPEEQEYLYKLLLAGQPPPEVHVIDGALLSDGRFCYRRSLSIL